MKKLFCVLLILTLTNCGSHETKVVNTNNSLVNNYFNLNMLGQVWILTSIDKQCTTTFTIQKAPASNYYPVDSIDMFITKNKISCYPAPGYEASIHYILSPLPDGSYHAMAWVWLFTSTPPTWCPFANCAQQVKPAPNSPMPYMAIPPIGLVAGTTLTYDTRYQVWFFNGINYNNFTTNTPANTVSFKTSFSIQPNGWLKVDAFEGECGHEISYYSNRGLEHLEYPNDASSICIATPANFNLVRD